MSKSAVWIAFAAAILANPSSVVSCSLISLVTPPVIAPGRCVAFFGQLFGLLNATEAASPIIGPCDAVSESRSNTSLTFLLYPPYVRRLLRCFCLWSASMKVFVAGGWNSMHSDRAFGMETPFFSFSIFSLTCSGFANMSSARLLLVVMSIRESRAISARAVVAHAFASLM